MDFATHDPARARRLRDEPDDFIAGLLDGFRFGICEDLPRVAQALQVRRRVYVEGSGYQVPVPDEYDQRSWLLFAEHVETKQVIGSMRITPRMAGPLEAEEYFDLPSRLRSLKAAEISRFAILPAFRKGTTFLPVVSLGLFKLVMEFLRSIGAHYMVICSKPERIWTFEWMRFQRTGLSGQYGVLGGKEHELLWYDFKRAPMILAGHPFREFFVSMQYREVTVPKRMPPLGIGIDFAEERLAMAAGR